MDQKARLRAQYGFQPDDDEEDDDVEEEEEEEVEAEAYEPEEEMDEMVAERDAFHRTGFERKGYAETEEEIFLNNMEVYARTHNGSFDRSNYPFYSILLSKYPHPRCLNPQACTDVMKFFNQEKRKYVWNKNQYDDLIASNTILASSSMLYRYIALFNEFAL